MARHSSVSAYTRRAPKRLYGVWRTANTCPSFLPHGSEGHLCVYLSPPRSHPILSAHPGPSWCLRNGHTQDTTVAMVAIELADIYPRAMATATMVTTVTTTATVTTVTTTATVTTVTTVGTITTIAMVTTIATVASL